MSEKEIRSMDSRDLSEKSEKVESPQKNLSTNIAEHLLHLMKEVTKEKVNPKTVGAACQCASELYKVMKLNLEIKKIGKWIE